MNERVRLSIDNGVADVRLNRADKLNAIDPDMFMAIAEVGSRLNGNRNARAVVLSGEGRAFCAGLDVERLKAVRSCRLPISLSGPTASPTGRSIWCGSGASFPCP
jgi:enoyl-CoA hydratase/carnithine racemase